MKILVLGLTLLCLLGCSMKAIIPEGCENSLYYKYYGQFKVGTILIKAGLDEFVTQYPEYQKDVLNGLTSLESMMKLPTATYMMLGLAVLSDVQWLNRIAGKKLLLAGEIVEVFLQDNTFINPCDRKAFALEIQRMKYYAGGEYE